jgi:hypothetical protein
MPKSITITRGSTMPKSITITKTFPPGFVRSIIKGFMDNYPEASMTLKCERWDYDKLQFTFWDSEEGKRYKIGELELVQAFELLFTDKWPRGLTTPPLSDDEEAWDARFWSHTDAIDADAFAQLAIFGKVIYG